MNPIRINEKNRDALETALTEANGRLDRYLDADDLLSTAAEAEAKLDTLAIRMADRPGAVAYTAEPASPWKSHAVTVAKAEIVRCPSGWFLQETSRGYSSGKGVIVRISDDQFDAYRVLDRLGVRIYKAPGALTDSVDQDEAAAATPLAEAA